MKLLFAYATNTGRERKNNEDSLLVETILLNEVSMEAPNHGIWERERTWFIVADGMGGESAGELASGTVLRHLESRVGQVKDPDDLLPLLNDAKLELDKIAAVKKVRLGTTMAGLFLFPDGGFAFNVGDCRVYKLNGGYLNRLTKDHSLSEEATAAGVADSDKIPKNIVTSALIGGDEEEMQVFARRVTPRPGDRYLICSDGLWGALPVDEMEKAFKFADPLEVAKALYPPALEKSNDNVSFIVVNVTK